MLSVCLSRGVKMSIIDLCSQLVAGGVLQCTDVAADAADDKL